MTGNLRRIHFGATSERLPAQPIHRLAELLPFHWKLARHNSDNLMVLAHRPGGCLRPPRVLAYRLDSVSVPAAGGWLSCHPRGAR